MGGVGSQKRLLGGIFTGAASVIIKTGLNILLIPVLLHIVGVDSYSLFVLIISILELILLMDLGFNSALIRMLGSSLGMDSTERGRELLRTGHWLYLLLTLAVTLVGWACLPLFKQMFNIPASLGSLADLCLLLVLAEGALTLYSFYYRSILFAHSMHHWVNLSETLFSIIGNVLGLVLVYNGGGLLSLFVARVVAAGIRTLIMVVQTYQIEKEVFRLTGKVHFHTLREITELSFHAAMINLSVQISHKIDSFIIAMFLPLSAVGIYEIVFRFLTVTQQISLKITEGVFPLFSRMAVAAQKAEARHLFLRISSFTHFSVAILLLLIVCFYPELFRMISDGKIRIEDTWPVFMVAVPIIWTGGLQMPAGPYLYASGLETYLTVSSLLGAFSNLILSLLLVKPFGLVGVALGTLIPLLIQHQASLIRRVCLDLNISFFQYIKIVHLQVIPALLIAWLWIKLLRPMFDWSGYPILQIGFVSLSALLLGAAVWLYFWATDAEKKAYLGKLAGKLVPQEVRSDE